MSASQPRRTPSIVLACRLLMGLNCTVQNVHIHVKYTITIDRLTTRIRTIIIVEGIQSNRGVVRKIIIDIW